ncbi:hypothetical protein PCNPT3_04910 [Psychromonas sp. CNPT3]|uniref:hypothetical protein n=1 Tax=Psychromonas sp. CNPT3 TaxID=314282 RepID=UPI00006E9E37|nr:hypothetical protein [Psychromonas sp. CNPT3]AGH80924.1 hypothetical protein PCNPT3_04910 [Psychromonas sp. CNPT3]
MNKLTKHDTILWINHAIAYFKSIEKNQKDLAKELGIEEARISEMKIGKGTILPSLMTNIVDLCGAPRRNPGRYEEVELYDDLDSFFDSYIDVTEDRFYRKILKIFKNKEYIKIIIHNIFSEEFRNENNKLEETDYLALKQINEIIKNTEFIDICSKCQKNLFELTGFYNFAWANRKGTYRDKEHLEIDGFCVRSRGDFHFLYLLWLVVEKYPDFKLGGKNNVNTPPYKELTPIVLTGNRLLIGTRDTNNFRTRINKEIEGKFGCSYRYPKLFDYDSPFEKFKLNNKIEPAPDAWFEVIYEVYLSENMNYHLLIHLSFDSVEQSIIDAEFNDNEFIVKPADRVVVIHNINSLDLFRKIEEIRKWIGLPKDNNYILKQQIAKAGGYVPGARVLI